MEQILASQIESILFWKGEPVSLQELAKYTNASIDECAVAVELLQRTLHETNRGIAVVSNGSDYELVTAPFMSARIAELTKEELTKDLSKAALETLSIVLYRGPIKRSELDYIRGVNSQSILRILSIRGLIVRTNDPHDDRTFTYSPSIELLKMLGVATREDLPDFQQVNRDIEAFMVNQTKENTLENPHHPEPDEISSIESDELYERDIK